jgi:hypothetical protein
LQKAAKQQRLVTCSDLKASSVTAYFFFVRCSRRRACVVEGTRARSSCYALLSHAEQLVLLAVVQQQRMQGKPGLPVLLALTSVTTSML